MLNQKIIQNSYYQLRPFLPRSFQIWLRRRRAQYIQKKLPNDWAILEKSSIPPIGWTGWPEGKQFAFVLLHDVERQGGHDKCLDLMALEMELEVRSCFNFVPERYNVSAELRQTLQKNGFEVGVHGLKHDGLLYSSYEVFQARAPRINHYLQAWNAIGVCSPASHHRLEWNHLWDAAYVSSTFDYDPFEPESDGMETIFPIRVSDPTTGSSYIELPYTLPQDHTLFIILQEQEPALWQKKLDWIATHGGMALLITHPDYMNFGQPGRKLEEYPVTLYSSFMRYVQKRYAGQYWQALPREVAAFWQATYAERESNLELAMNNK